jgi:hypothetical protein
VLPVSAKLPRPGKPKTRPTEKKVHSITAPQILTCHHRETTRSVGQVVLMQADKYCLVMHGAFSTQFLIFNMDSFSK